MADPHGRLLASRIRVYQYRPKARNMCRQSMSRDIDSIIAVTKVLLAAAPWDQVPKCCPMPWRSEMFEEAKFRPLVIAVMRDDGVVRPHPPIQHVLDVVVAKLQQAGHEVVTWTPGTLHQECIDIMVCSRLSIA